MWRLLVVFLAVPLFGQKPIGDGLADLATQISASAQRQEKQRIAVLPFRELEGQASVLSTYVAEELVTNLFQLGNFKIVEREFLDRILGELKIQQSGAIDPATAKEIGRIAAVDAIVTGSITDMESFVAVHCRLIDTTTGEVFGAAQTKIIKDDDVKKIMRHVIGTEPRALPRATATLTTKDFGPLRVSLRSVTPARNGVLCTLEFLNREARRSTKVALNAQGLQDGVDDRMRQRDETILLRAQLNDEQGGQWHLTTYGVQGIGWVRAGVHGRKGEEAYSPTEITRLLRLRETLGRDTDDPADGVTAQADSMGEGGSNITFGGGRVTSPEQFFRNRGNRFISGATTTIEAGESLTVTLHFARPGGWPPSSSFQFTSEIVVGIQGEPYTLHNLSFPNLRLPTR